MKLLEKTSSLYELPLSDGPADHKPAGRPAVIYSGDVVSVERRREQLGLVLTGLARAYQTNRLVAATVWSHDVERREQEEKRLLANDGAAVFGLGRPPAHLGDAWEAFGRAYGWESPNAWREFACRYGGGRDTEATRNAFRTQLQQTAEK